MKLIDEKARLEAHFESAAAVRRKGFDRELAAFVRRFPERWHIEALTETLEAVTRLTGDAQLVLQRRPGGELDVQLRFTLAPVLDSHPFEQQENRHANL